MECTHSVRPVIGLVNAGRRSKAPAVDQERGDEQREVDRKAMFLRPQLWQRAPQAASV